MGLNDLVGACRAFVTSPSNATFNQVRNELAEVPPSNGFDHPTNTELIRSVESLRASISGPRDKEAVLAAARRVAAFAPTPSAGPAAPAVADVGRAYQPVVRTSPRPSARQYEVTEAALDAVGGIFTLGKYALGAAGLALLAGGWFYGHSDEFKLECTAQKLGAETLSFPKNILCDAMFDIG